MSFLNALRFMPLMVTGLRVLAGTFGVEKLARCLQVPVGKVPESLLLPPGVSINTVDLAYDFDDFQTQIDDSGRYLEEEEDKKKKKEADAKVAEKGEGGDGEGGEEKDEEKVEKKAVPPLSIDPASPAVPVPEPSPTNTPPPSTPPQGGGKKYPQSPYELHK